MLTKGKTSKFRVAKYLVVVVALIAVLAMCLTACSGPAVKDVKYVDGSVTKAVYNEGEAFDCAGAKITVTYEDGTTATVDVTAAMTGAVVLKGVGEKDVAVSYTEEGTTYTAYIPVTVVNPTKSNAIAALKTDAVAAANPDDKGVQKLIEAYTALITDAATADVATLSSEYTAAVKAYVDAKAACLATINDTALVDGLYAQYLEKAYTAKVDALVLYNTATETAAFAEIANAYKTAVEKLFADQEFYEGNDSGNGQIIDKIELLYKIEDYSEKIAERAMEVISAQTDAAKIEFYTVKYQNIMNKLDYFYKYVNLAIDLNKTAKMIEEYYVGVMRTPVDDIYDALCDVETKIEITYSDVKETTISSVTITVKSDIMADGVGITVIPAPYVKDEATGEVTGLGTDTLGALLEKIQDFYDAAVEEFGVDNVDAWLDDYTPFDAAEGVSVDLTALVEEFYDVYDSLVVAQQAAEDVIDAIDAIDLTDDTKTVAQHQADILAAWNALITWNNAHGILSNVVAPTFATDSTAGSAYAIAYENMFDGIYNLGLDAEGQVAKSWAEYALDKDYVLTYMIYNLDALLDASIVGERMEVERLIANIQYPLVYSTDAAVDSKAAIEAARAAYDKYETLYADRMDNEVFFPVDDNGNIVMEATIAKAEADYQAIVDAANALIAKIDALKAPANITIGDYETTKDGIVTDGALKIAYNDYIDFTTNINNNYNDVIEVDGKEEKLLNCIKQYIVLAFEDAKNVEGKVTISGELLRCLGMTNAETDTAIRAELSTLEETQRAALAGETYDNSGVGELELISDFEEHLVELHEKAEELADAITVKFDAWAASNN